MVLEVTGKDAAQDFTQVAFERGDCLHLVPMVTTFRDDHSRSAWDA
jgi:hypothetical protein